MGEIDRELNTVTWIVLFWIERVPQMNIRDMMFRMVHPRPWATNHLVTKSFVLFILFENRCEPTEKMGRLGRSCHVSGLFCPPKSAVIVLLLGVISTAFALGKGTATRGKRNKRCIRLVLVIKPGRQLHSVAIGLVYFSVWTSGFTCHGWQCLWSIFKEWTKTKSWVYCIPRS